MTWLFDNFDYVWSLTLRHVWLSAVPIVLGFVIALPIGWFANRHPRLAGHAPQRRQHPLHDPVARRCS